MTKLTAYSKLSPFHRNPYAVIAPRARTTTFLSSLVFWLVILSLHAAWAEAQEATNSKEESHCEMREPLVDEKIESRGEKCFIADDTLYIRGIIGSKTLAAFRAHPIQKINMSSPGGSVTVAEAFAREVRQLGVHTEVPQNGACYSSCTLVFQAGVRRTAHPSAHFLYHCTGLGPFMAQAIQQQCGLNYLEYKDSCANDLADLVAITIESTQEYFENYLTYGGVGLYERMMAEPNLEDWFKTGNFCKKRLVISAEETMSHNVVQELTAE